MKYHLHENGWTVIVDDFDFREATQQDVNEIAKLIATNTCVLFKNQLLSVDDEMRISTMFKNPRPFVTPGDDQCTHYWVKGTDGIFQRVTGELNEHGVSGIAAHIEDFEWHCNWPSQINRRPIIWLYGVKGTAGSRTSWTNNILSYNDLSQEWKDRLENLTFITGDGENDSVAVERKIVHTNIAGKKGLFFPFNQMQHVVDVSEEENREIINYLSNLIIQDKYCYHHSWTDGDLIISEQWLGIHKRWRFEQIATRLLHRGEFDFPDQDYQ